MAQRKDRAKGSGIRKETVAVIGLGRVGLPLALCFAEAGLRAYGIDISANLIDLLKKKMPFLEEGAAELLEKHIGTDFLPTTNLAEIRHADAIILT